MPKFIDPYRHLPHDDYAYYHVESGSPAREAIDRWMTDLDKAQKLANTEIRRLRREIRKPFKGLRLRITFGDIQFDPFKIPFEVKAFGSAKEFYTKMSNALINMPDEYQKIWKFSLVWYDEGIVKGVVRFHNSGKARTMKTNTLAILQNFPRQRDWWHQYVPGTPPGETIATQDGRMVMRFIHPIRPLEGGPWFVLQPFIEGKGVSSNLENKLAGLYRCRVSEYWRMLENFADHQRKSRGKK